MLERSMSLRQSVAAILRRFVFLVWSPADFYILYLANFPDVKTTNLYLTTVRFWQILVTGREWELNLRHHGNGIGNGNELVGMGGNGNVASHFSTSLVQLLRVLITKMLTVLCMQMSLSTVKCLGLRRAIIMYHSNRKSHTSWMSIMLLTQCF